MKPTTIAEFFQLLPASLDRDAAEDVTAVYQFDLSGDQGGQYSVQVKDGTCSVQTGAHTDPHVDRKSTRLNSSHMSESRMPSSA